MGNPSGSRFEHGTDAGLKVRNCAAFHGGAVLIDGYSSNSVIHRA